MIRNLTILITILFTSLTVSGQNLFFIGEKSYQCTESVDLQPNEDDVADLNVLLGKDNNNSYFIIQTKPNLNSTFSGKLIIYLDNGKVVTCNDFIVSDNVDGIAKAVYSLNKEQLNELKNSNINTVRYTLNVLKIKEVNQSASNKKTQPRLISRN